MAVPFVMVGKVTVIRGFFFVVVAANNSGGNYRCLSKS